MDSYGQKGLLSTPFGRLQLPGHGGLKLNSFNSCDFHLVRLTEF